MSKLQRLFLLFSLLPVFLFGISSAQNSSSAASAPAAGANTPIQIAVDVTDAPRRMLHAKLRFPVTPGPLTLYYPKWIPGEHEPSGPITDLTGLIFTTNGQTLPWRRDSVDMFAFHVTVPPEASELNVSLDFLTTAGAEGFSAGASTSSQLAIISWNQLLLYPLNKDKPIGQLLYAPSVRLPNGWKSGTALTPTKDLHDGTIQFEPVPLEQLIDSPVLAGAHFREIGLDKAGKHFLEIAADSDPAVDVSSEVIKGHTRLVTEAGALFGAHHYDAYHFLVTLSDHVAHFGLEHHQSSDDRVGEKTFTDENARRASAGLLPHEFTHSWNGKYRRPAGLATPDYQQPMKGDLLWVYEGLTEYIGGLLAARSGMWTPDEWHDKLAIHAAQMGSRTGRSWRDLQDTATSAPFLYETSEQWENWRRGVDFYPEGELLWLEADVLIRQQTHGKRSLNDFCKRFFGAPTSGPKVVPYTFEDVVADLNAIAPYDWAKFLESRLATKDPQAPVSGIEGGGWKLAYVEWPSELEQITDDQNKVGDFRYGLGLTVKDDGGIGDVMIGSPAYKAGLGPGMKILAAHGRHFSLDAMHAAVRAAKNETAPIEFIIENTDYVSVVPVDYHGGERYPVLQRIEGKPDILSEIAKPLVPEESK